jgi:7,8-dihydropterin-6-yl-methyl-4-(beta-D-ribofuranosyl)aminobenzene 5'-phosphate synthase
VKTSNQRELVHYLAGKVNSKFGAAWHEAKFELIDKPTEISPGITNWCHAPGTKELKELSLAVNTAERMVLIVGCSHPVIDKIVEAAAAITPKMRIVAVASTLSSPLMMLSQRQ